MICIHCGSHVTDQGETIHTACVGPALVERRRLRAEIAARLLPEIMDNSDDQEAKDLAKIAVGAADALLAALDGDPEQGEGE